MKTKDRIKAVACELFNQHGLSEVTLRDVAQAMNRAYGNITYHFPNKEAVVIALYRDMAEGLWTISSQFQAKQDLLEVILRAPGDTFSLSMRYLFLYKDFLEIVRHFPEVSEAARQSNTLRKGKLKLVMQQLQALGDLRAELSDAELDYLMELSGAMRTFFFVQLTPEEFHDPDLAAKYVAYVNGLLFPYLTQQGQERYLAILGKW